MLVDGDDGHDDAVFGQVFPIADDDFVDFLERARIDADAARGDRLAAVGAVVGEFNGLAVFDQQDFLGHRADRVRQGGVERKSWRYSPWIGMK